MTSSKKVYNPNLVHLVKSEKSGYSGAVLEGSSRSGKTWSSVDFIVKLCSDLNYPAGTINIIKETYNSFKTTLYDDFNRRLPDYGLYSPFSDKKEVDSFHIFETKINLMGADKPSKFHGASCDYFYINESLDVSQDIFDQQEMRCRKFWWMDYNPKATEHYIFNKVLTRSDVAYLKTTFLDNPHISEKEKKKILSYEPTAKNIKEGTADDYMWKVYGLGERAAPQGLIFKNVNYIDQFPDLDFHYGMDFGFTVDPNAIVKYAETETDIYLELECYEPLETPEQIDEYARARGMNIKKPFTADSSDKYTGENKGTVEMVKGLKKLGWNIKKVSKTKGVMFWLNSMRAKRINIVNNELAQYAKNEQLQYKFKEIHGIQINQPIDSYNHFWDAGRYAHMAANSNNKVPVIW